MTTPDLLTMSRKELDRAEWMQRVHEQRMTQRDAAERLGLSLRQVERLYRAYKVGGAAALTSKKRGRPSSHRLSDGLRAETIGLVRAKYGDFGPTLAREKLIEVHGIDVSVETLRKWMIDQGRATAQQLLESIERDQPRDQIVRAHVAIALLVSAQPSTSALVSKVQLAAARKPSSVAPTERPSGKFLTATFVLLGQRRRLPSRPAASARQLDARAGRSRRSGQSACRVSFNATALERLLEVCKPARAEPSPCPTQSGWSIFFRRHERRAPCCSSIDPESHAAVRW